MRLLQVWQVGGVPASICQMSTLPSHQVLQQRMPEIRLGVSPALVPHDSLITISGLSFLISMHTGSHSVIHVSRLILYSPRSHYAWHLKFWWRFYFDPKIPFFLHVWLLLYSLLRTALKLALTWGSCLRALIFFSLLISIS